MSEARNLALTIAASRAEVGRALEETRTFLATCEVDEEAIGDVCLALDELLANVVLHGYAGRPEATAQVFITVSDDAVRAEVRDQAPRFDPLTLAAPELDGEARRNRIGGLGVHLVRAVMDDVRYAREGDDNVLRLARLRRR